MQAIQEGSRLNDLLEWCEELKASDLHAQAGQPFTVRVDGQLQRMHPDDFPPFASSEEIYNELSQNFTAEIVAATVLCGEISLGSAITAEEWVSSHEQYGRNR